MIYEQFFELTQRPFSIAPNPQFLYENGQYREALGVLEYGLCHRGGFVLLTGEVGTGKTTLCRQLLNHIPSNTEVALILHPQLDRLEFLHAICNEFGIEWEESDQEFRLTTRIYQYLLKVFSQGGNAVLIVDEAQHLDASVLEQVRLLTNLETNDEKLLQIILLGQPELKERLARYELRQLNQRITVRFHLNPLSRKEISEYIRHRLGVAGTKQKIFSGFSVRRLHKLTRGIPRLINVVADRALMGAYADNQKVVSAKIVSKAAIEVLPEEFLTKSKLSYVFAAAAAIAIIFVGWYGVNFYFKPDIMPDPTLAQSNASPAVSQTQPRPRQPEVEQSGASNLIEDLLSSAMDASLDDLAAYWGVTPREACLAPRQCWRGELPTSLMQQANVPSLIEINDRWYRYKAERPEFRKLAEFKIIWQPPYEFNKALKVGDVHDLVSWVRNIIQTGGAQQTTDDGWEVIQPEGGTTIYTPGLEEYDWLLEQQVRQFQAKHGLKTDGLIGSQTLIALWLKSRQQESL